MNTKWWFMELWIVRLPSTHQAVAWQARNSEIANTLVLGLGVKCHRPQDADIIVKSCMVRPHRHPFTPLYRSTLRIPVTPHMTLKQQAFIGWISNESLPDMYMYYTEHGNYSKMVSQGHNPCNNKQMLECA